MSAKDGTNIVFENMMRLAEYGANRHAERRQVLFRIFISYMTLLVVIFGLILEHWETSVLKEGLFAWGVSHFLILMFCCYWWWLVKFYTASDHDVRRRDFYLTKAQIISYYMSEELSRCYSDCEKVPINLGNKSYKMSEKYLFKEKRHPDINPKTDPDINKKCPPSPTVKCNPHFYFHFVAPAGLTLLIAVVLGIEPIWVMLVSLVACILIDKCMDR